MANGTNRINRIRRITETRTTGFVEGRFIPLFTAQAWDAVYSVADEPLRRTLDTCRIDDAEDMVFRMLNYVEC